MFIVASVAANRTKNINLATAFSTVAAPAKNMYLFPPFPIILFSHRCSWLVGRQIEFELQRIHDLRIVEMRLVSSARGNHSCVYRTEAYASVCHRDTHTRGVSTQSNHISISDPVIRRFVANHRQRYG
jgi:hypothetical protein